MWETREESRRANKLDFRQQLEGPDQTLIAEMMEENGEHKGPGDIRAAINRLDAVRSNETKRRLE